MTCDVTWLPDLNVCRGDEGEYVESLYQLFTAKFVEEQITFLGRPVHIPRTVNPQTGRIQKFEHLITEVPPSKKEFGDESEEAREVEHERCRRLEWIACLLSEAPTNRTRTWRERSRGEYRWGCALSDFSYVVITAERRDYFQLVTAFPVQGPRRREKFRDTWRQFEQNEPRNS